MAANKASITTNVTQLNCISDWCFATAARVNKSIKKKKLFIMFEKEITHSKMLQLQQTNLLLQQGMYDFTEVPLLQKF